MFTQVNTKEKMQSPKNFEYLYSNSCWILFYKYITIFSRRKIAIQTEILGVKAWKRLNNFSNSKRVLNNLGDKFTHLENKDVREYVKTLKYKPR